MSINFNLSAALLLLLATSAWAFAPVDDVITQAIEKGESLNILIHFPPRPRAEASLQKLSRPERQKLVFNELLAAASASQDAIRTNLQERGFEVQTIWLGNTMYIKKATPALIRELRQIKTVMSLEAEKIVARINEPMIHEVFERLPAKKAGAVEWNIELIGAADIWNVTKGYSVVIANIDTGVRYTHESLRRRYRGSLGNGIYDHDYSWYDPTRIPYPNDNNGHGTHTMGTIIGDDTVSGIGVAPEALWIAAKGCATSSCSNIDLINSFQYLFAPSRQDGTGADPSYAPQIISNSWGGGQGSTAFLPYIEPHVEVGTVVVFSQGNSGSSCNTANSPGDLDIVIGVGSTNVADQLSSFSSRGPGIDGLYFNRQKPDISAPGERVLSAYYTSDTAYASLSGTSMACPHVAGLLGLVYDVSPRLTVDAVRELLENTATNKLNAPVGGLTTCGGVEYTSYPNFQYGYGRIDAVSAVNTALRNKHN